MKLEKMIACHSLPCSIEGNSETAAVEAYFLPTLLESSSLSSSPSSNIYAASFRGRGLLGNQVAVTTNESSGAGNEKLQPNMLHGCLLQVENSTHHRKTSPTAHALNNDNDDDDEMEEGTLTVRMPTVWQNVYEWHHTHQPTTITLQNKPNRWQRAQEWCQVAQALHGEEDD